MPTMDDVNSELRQMGVLPGEVSVSRKVYAKIMEKATEIVENDDTEEE